MESNNLARNIEKNKIKFSENKYYNIEVTLVLYDITDAKEENVKFVKDYCLTKNILFSTRRYNSYSHRHDREYISQLPAFHIYINKIHQRTVYVNTRPLQHIDEIINLYVKMEEEKRIKEEKWKEFKRRVVRFFSIKNIFHKKSLLEKTIEQNKNNNINRRHSFSNFEELKKSNNFKLYC